ncbi:hypothetical protein BD779DRAFT_93970 [Infundibulicybe gibba]|nr:hypothetical protein BD779DRAFT_93970 [Infundibulicybe gibba]
MPTSSGNTIIIDVDAFRDEVDLTVPDEPIDLTGPPPIIDLPKIEEDRKFRKQRARLRAQSRNKSSGGSLTPQSRTPPLAQPSSSAKIFIVESSPPSVDVAMELSPPPVEAAVVGLPPSPHRSPEYELMELIVSDEERGSERMQISDEDDSTSDEEYPWMAVDSNKTKRQ